MRIGIIGSGISGLTAAYRLCAQHEITLFEASGYLGGHTNTVDVECDGEHQVIDTGFIVFNDWTYPNFIQLLDELNVRSRPTSMSFSVRDDRSRLEYNGSSLNGLFAQRGNLLRPSFHRMVRDILRFNREESHSSESAEQRLSGFEEETVDEYLVRKRFSREFAEHYLLPMGAAIWSCPTGTFAEFPMRFILEFYRNHGLLSIRNRPTWRVIEGGSRTYVAAMAQRFSNRVRLNTSIECVCRSPEFVEITPRGGSAEPFDHVVFACHSDQALRLLSDATPTERELLSAFPYERNTAVLHTDISILPQHRRAWASWNYHTPAQPTAHATVTYNMNILQHLQSRQVFCVTLNSDHRIDPQRVLRKFEYHHPIFTARRAAVQARHGELLNSNRSSFCGAYWGNGFHEDGVVSALAVCRSLMSAE